MLFILQLGWCVQAGAKIMFSDILNHNLVLLIGRGRGHFIAASEGGVILLLPF